VRALEGLRRPFAAFLAALLAAGCSLSAPNPSAPPPTPGPEEARAAWRAVVGPSKPPRPTVEPKEINLDFLKPLFEFIARNRMAFTVLGIALLALAIAFVAFLAVRRAPRSLPALLSRKRKALAADGPEADAEEGAPSAELYARAIQAAEGGDPSRATVLLRRARVAELVETGVLASHLEHGDREIAQALSRSGASEGAYRILARAADSVLFGERSIGADRWRELLAAYAESKAEAR
jgi:hypothetical protein